MPWQPLRLAERPYMQSGRERPPAIAANPAPQPRRTHKKCARPGNYSVDNTDMVERIADGQAFISSPDYTTLRLTRLQPVGYSSVQ
jgi:hypothetical protein